MLLPRVLFRYDELTSTEVVFVIDLFSAIMTTAANHHAVAPIRIAVFFSCTKFIAPRLASNPPWTALGLGAAFRGRRDQLIPRQRRRRRRWRWRQQGWFGRGRRWCCCGRRSGRRRGWGQSGGAGGRGGRRRGVEVTIIGDGGQVRAEEEREGAPPSDSGILRF